MRPRFPYVSEVGVLAYRGVGEVRVDERIADADKIEIRRDKDKGADATLRRFWKSCNLGEDSSSEVFEAGVRVCKVGRRVEAGEGLFDAIGEGFDETGCVVFRILQTACDVAHVPVVEGVDLGCEVCG